jgi:organic hydroperoxide reductase OsmC/OhrA
MSIAPFPHRYTVSLASGELVAPPRARIAAGAPPQFGGTDQVWSPEDLLAASALLCLQTTFDAFARRASLRVLDWRGDATATLEKGQGGPTFSSIALAVAVTTEPGENAGYLSSGRPASRQPRMPPSIEITFV